MLEFNMLSWIELSSARAGKVCCKLVSGLSSIQWLRAYTKFHYLYLPFFFDIDDLKAVFFFFRTAVQDRPIYSHRCTIKVGKRETVYDINKRMFWTVLSGSFEKKKTAIIFRFWIGEYAQNIMHEILARSSIYL